MGGAATFNGYLDMKSKLVFKPSLLALVPLLVTIPAYPPNKRMLAAVFSSGVGLDYLAASMGAACLICSFALILKSVNDARWPGFGKPLTRLSALGYVAAQIGLGACLVLEAHELAFAAIGLLAGACLIPIVLRWIREFSLDLRNIMLYGAIVCIASLVLTWILTVLPAGPCAAALPILAACGAAVAFVEGDAPQETFPKKYQSEAAVAQESSLASLRELLSIIWLPLTGFLLFALITSIFSYSFGSGATSELIGGAIASTLAIVLCALRIKTPMVILIDKLVIPIVMGASIVFGSFPTGSVPFFIGASSVLAPMIFVAIFALASLVVVTTAGEFPVPFIFGAMFLLANLMVLVGTALLQAIPDSLNLGSMLWVLICVYFAVVIIHSGYSSWRQAMLLEGSAEGPVSEAHQEPEAFGRFWAQRLDRLAEYHGLTKREREILGYMSRGYGSSFIAKNLFISNNTARTHIRNIYHKLDVGSREEFLLKLEETGAEDAKRERKDRGSAAQ